VPTATNPPPPPPTQAPPPTEPPPPPAPAAGAHGINGKITFRENRNTYRVGEQVFVNIEAVNVTGDEKQFGFLGLTPSTGGFHTSWDNSSIKGGETFRHEDGYAFPVPGTHRMWLTICFSDKETCQGPSGDWERFEPGLEVIVQ
jgi:hypothetical protein